MGKWLDLAAKLEGESAGDIRDNRDESPGLSPIVPNVPIVPSLPGLSASHVSLVAGWRAGLASLDPLKPRAGLRADRWERLVLDAFGLFNGWGPQAVALGWDTLDLFGVHPSKRGHGQTLYGLAARLDGFRVVAMCENMAVLEGKGSGVPSRYFRGDTSKLVPLWGLQ